ncbi:GNAT family N-acetyltransferase [Spirosoma radiotolerans]|uniref:GCN5 family acetyltransferase n=1 Tax=Spirosoma radiotolerans TaxID=1379870 RepID=A0A0E3ZTF1_9BACT|nr:N-acetyltransferase [Spirosoma radiotolerans]AKD54585.1 GCN5 family acetyltransferase [Spirosoma radiotolerans]
MNILIRQETPADYKAVSNLIQEAYRQVAYSDKKEQLMVDRLRKSTAFIPQLSLVAQLDTHELVGHIMLTKLHIQDGHQQYPGLALAPLSIPPAFQHQGIGSQLIRASHKIAKAQGYRYSVVLGHATYYPKFGYERLSQYPIELPIRVADENSMIRALAENGLEGVKGQVVYASEFFS